MIDPAVLTEIADAAENLAAACRRAIKTSPQGLAEAREPEQLSTSMPATATLPVAQDRPLLSQQQLANRLGCDVRTLRRWTHEELVPPPIRIGNALRWDPEVVEAWLEDGGGRPGARVSRDRARVRSPHRRGPR